MPLYEYRCHCGAEFDLLAPVSAASEPGECPDCGDGAERVLSSFVAGPGRRERADFSRVPFESASCCGGACGHAH